MTNEQWLAEKVLEQAQIIAEKDRKIADLRELFQAQTLECAHLAERIDFLFLVLAKVSAPTPAIEVPSEFPTLTERWQHA